MVYMDVAVLNDGETFTGIYGSRVILNTIEDEDTGNFIVTEDSLTIRLEDLVSTYLEVNKIKPTFRRST